MRTPKLIVEISHIYIYIYRGIYKNETKKTVLYNTLFLLWVMGLYYDTILNSMTVLKVLIGLQISKLAYLKICQFEIVWTKAFARF